mmetsp:Transcript_48669/g.122463  ORF Transcript_48669/g.122463 Transcript_48669/m.122463 type:complete len:128 (-) Transcript_48669:408-791(-)
MRLLRNMSSSHVERSTVDSIRVLSVEAEVAEVVAEEAVMEAVAVAAAVVEEDKAAFRTLANFKPQKRSVWVAAADASRSPVPSIRSSAPAPTTKEPPEHACKHSRDKPQKQSVCRVAVANASLSTCT